MRKKNQVSDDEWVEAPVHASDNNIKDENNKKIDEFDFLFSASSNKAKELPKPIFTINRELNKNILNDKDYLESFSSPDKNITAIKNVKSWNDKMSGRLNESYQSKFSNSSFNKYNEKDPKLHSLTLDKPDSSDEHDVNNNQYEIYQSIDKMIKEEKYISARDINSPFIKMSQQTFSSMGNARTLNERFKIGSKRSNLSEEQKISKIKKREQLIIDDCFYCNMTHQFEAQYVIKKYDNLLIVLPHTRCIVNTHFRIIPIRHVSDSTCLDFEVSREIQDVFNQLCISLSKNKKIPIFIETFYDVTKRVHMNIDGFIFDENFISDFKIFFKKAIIESDQEWSDHKKLILLKGSKVSDKVPRGFPFFCVTFGNEESYIHIIEDKKRFPKTFGLEILGGYFDADPTIWLHPNSDTEQSIKDRAKIMSELFSQLDF